MSNALRVINAIIDSMKELLGVVPTLYYIRDVGGLQQMRGKIIRMSGDEKEKVTALATRFQQHMGNAALIAINEQLKPLIKADKKILELLPDSLIYFLEKEVELNKKLIKK